ncbi:MAG: PAS domain-containing protein [Planctomycetes bacterium]|nr:PAS domain-containing protein [Planctomycetota bacterium]
MAARGPFGSGLLGSRFFWNLLASYAALLLVTGVLVGWQVQSRLEASLLRELEETLRRDCEMLAPLASEALRGDVPASLAAELERLSRATGLRTTFVAADGRVALDSSEDARAMDDHSSRPEIVQARAETFGGARRRSHTVGLDMLYVARRLNEGDSEGDSEGERVLGFVRVALPVSQIEGQLASARRSVVLGTGAGVLLALVLGLVLSQHFVRPIAAMKRTAQDLLAGRYDSRVRVTRRDELGLLGETLNALGAETTRRIAALSQEDAQLRAVLAGMIEGVVAVDEADRVAFMNQAARVLLQVAESAPEGMALWKLAPIRELEGLLGRARTSGAPERSEVELFRGGKELVFQAHASPFQGGGKAGFVLVLHDITELRRLERVRRDFVANVSHELKTPLTSIQGFVETLLSGALEDKQNNVRFLRTIEANVKRLTSLVTDLLSLARIESGALEVESAVVDWRDVLEQVLRLREPALLAKELILEVRGREKPVRVRGDREAMTQVLDNLIDNAVQYTPRLGRVVVSLASRDGQGSIAIADTGIGIPSADLDRIFERFYRVDKARSRAAGGTGLGLSIVKNLVLRMQGEVTVSSVEGRGSTFTVLLPLG